jgi:hypothetical protein
VSRCTSGWVPQRVTTATKQDPAAVEPYVVIPLSLVPHYEGQFEMSTIDQRGRLAEEPFSFRTTKDGVVFISWRGTVVTTLRGKRATTFLARLDGLGEEAAQLAMAKATGHFKHGNEHRR